MSYHHYSYNGGKTIAVKDEHVEVSKSVTKADFDAIVDFCREHKLFVLTYHEGFIIYEGDHEYMNIEKSTIASKSAFVTLLLTSTCSSLTAIVLPPL